MSDARTKVDALKDLGEKITGKTITIDENETIVSIIDKITENYDGGDTPTEDTKTIEGTSSYADISVSNVTLTKAGSLLTIQGEITNIAEVDVSLATMSLVFTNADGDSMLEPTMNIYNTINPENTITFEGAIDVTTTESADSIFNSTTGFEVTNYTEQGGGEGTITLEFPAMLPLGIYNSDPNAGDAGTVEFAPYLDSSYSTTVNEIAQGIAEGTLTEVIVNQDGSTWTFNNFEYSDSTISLMDTDQGIGTSLQVKNQDENYIWVGETNIQFAKATAPDSSVDNRVVFAEAIANTNFENIINNVTDGSLIFLTQVGLYDGYICNYSTTVSPNDTATLTFEYGESASMTVELHWYNEEGEEAGRWDFTSASVSSGFENINTNV